MPNDESSFDIRSWAFFGHWVFGHWSFSPRGHTLWALAQVTQVLQGVDAGVVAVAPDDLVGVVADGPDADGLERHQLARLENAKRVRWLESFLPAAGAGTLLA